MRILVADELVLAPIEELTVLGVQVDYQPELTASGLPEALAGAAIVVVRTTSVTRAAIEATPGLSLIVCAGREVDVVDVEAASRQGIYVAHCPDAAAAAVAELSLGMLIALDRGLLPGEAAVGRVSTVAGRPAAGLFGRRLGIAGTGAVGRRVIELGRAFGMELAAWSQSLSPQRARRLGVRHAASLTQLAGSVDALSIHLPPGERVRAVVSREVLEALPDRAIVVSTSGHEVIDGRALAERGPAKGLRVGLDTAAAGVAAGQSETLARLAGIAGVRLTPGIAAATEQARRAVSEQVSRIVRAFLTEEEVPQVVNVCRNTPARYTLVLRMRDEVGVLANVLSVVKRHGLNIEEINNTVFRGAAAACTKLRVTGRPGEDCLGEILAFDEVLHADVVALPNLA